MCPFGASMPRSPALIESFAARTDSSLAATVSAITTPSTLMQQCSWSVRAVPTPGLRGDATLPREQVPRLGCNGRPGSVPKTK